MTKTATASNPQPSRRPTLRAWFQLFRLPNLLTAPGDPIAGFLLANTGLVALFPRLLWVALASLCFYTGGLVFNDWADRDRDAAERPDRPLPSSSVTPGQALLAGCLLFALGLIFCMAAGPQTFWLGLCLCALIQTYNLSVKEVAVLGPLVMGACRGVSVLLGASGARDNASIGSGAWTAAILLAAYVASITQLSRKETGPTPPTLQVWMPLTVLVLGLTLAVRELDHLNMVRRTGLILPYLAACGVALFVAVRVTFRGKYKNIRLEIQKRTEVMEELPSLIGRLIGSLLFLQAGFIFASGKGMVAMVLGSGVVVCWVVNQNLRRWFYES